MEIGYDDFLAEIYDYAPYFGKERREHDYATSYYLSHLPEVNKGKILEWVTCTGLLTIPLARAGYSIESVDASASVHEIVKRKLRGEKSCVLNNIALRCENVLEYSSIERFSAIVMPDSFLQAVPNERLQEKLIERSYEYLKDGGILIMDNFNPWEGVIKKKEMDQVSRFRTERGKVYIMKVHHLVDEYRQLHEFQFEWLPYGEEKVIRRTITYRYLFRWQLVELLRMKGYKILDIHPHMNYGTNNAIVAQKVKI